MYILFLFKIFPFEFSTGLFFTNCNDLARSIILETRQDIPAPIENLIMHQNKTKQNRQLEKRNYLFHDSFKKTNPFLSFVINEKIKCNVM